MSMSVTRLTTYWDAGEAYTVIAFLDELRDLLWATYGEDIEQMLRNCTTDHTTSEEQLDLDLEDPIPF